MITIYCELIAQENNPLGYITYVFKSLDANQKEYLKSNYLMCVRFPNWDHKELKLHDVGFLNYKEIKEGIDTWFDGNKFIPYNNSNIQFIKFVTKPINTSSEIVLD